MGKKTRWRCKRLDKPLTELILFLLKFNSVNEVSEDNDEKKCNKQNETNNIEDKIKQIPEDIGIGLLIIISILLRL